MRRLLWFLLATTILLTNGCGGCRDPRVVQCHRCGEIQGVIGGLLPGQGSRCDCGGYIQPVRRMSYAEWKKCQKRGYVTLQDGYPVQNSTQYHEPKKHRGLYIEEYGH